MVFLNPLFNNDENRPYRWALQYVNSGDIIDGTWLPDDKFVHWTTKPTATSRDVFTDVSPQSIGNFTPMRKRLISFLTTHHKDMYEDGKYTEVFNDPVNYIFAEDQGYIAAYLTAEARIGNYRSGVRRHITHLGGTLSEDELDMLEDSQVPPVALSSFPLFPPLPTTDFGLPFRTKLVTSDVGYIDYVKTAHPDEDLDIDKYAYRSEQGTGFRRFVYSAGVAPLIEYETTTAPISVSKVQIEDLETVVNTSLVAAIDGTTLTKKFLPDDGEDILINFAGQNILRSNKDGIHLEVYDDVKFTELISLIDIDRETGDIFIGAGTTDISITKNGAITIDDGTRSIVLGTLNIVLTNGSRSITVSSSAVTIA